MKKAKINTQDNWSERFDRENELHGWIEKVGVGERSKAVKDFIKDLLKEERAGAKVEMLNMVEKPCVTTILSLTAEEALAEYKQKLIKLWNARIEEVKQGLDEEYGKNHNYTPNYEGIFEVVLDEVEAVIREEGI